jgi:hypothetical protein
VYHNAETVAVHGALISKHVACSEVAVWCDSFCRECIDHSIDAGEMDCPTCNKEGKKTMLGQRALLDRRLQMDHVLWDMIRKVFPRPELEVEIEKRKLQVKPLSSIVYEDISSSIIG